MPSDAKLSSFVDWCQKHIKGDEKGQAQIFLDRLFQSFDQPGVLEFRVRKSNEDGGGDIERNEPVIVGGIPTNFSTPPIPHHHTLQPTRAIVTEVHTTLFPIRYTVGGLDL